MLLDTNQQRPFNYGLAVLRIWMCFEVVLGHCTLGNPQLLNTYFFGFAVPIFMLISFFLTDTKRFVENRQYRAKRLFRIIVPQIVWTVIYFLFFKVANIAFHSHREVDMASFIWQLLFGNTFNASMWYQSSLIILTLAFWGIYKAFVKITPPPLYILPTITILAVVFSYSGIEQQVFATLPEEMRTTLGRTIGMIPLAIAGIYLRSYAIPERLVTYRKPLLVYMAVYVLFCLLFPVFTEPQNAFGYQGLYTITVSLTMFLFFYLLPLEKCPEKILTFIQNASKYTMGVYCIHRMIRHIVRTVTPLESKPLTFTILVFAISYALSFLLAKLPWKWVKVCVT